MNPPMPRLTSIVPARAGSKRIPRKNLAMVAGRPLIAWTIQAAAAAKAVARVIVSTDDAEIASAAIACGAEVPFLRPPHLATDEARSVDVVEHVLACLRERGEMPEAVVLMQPTSPLRTAADVDAAAHLFETSGGRPVVSVTRLEHPLQWVRRIGTAGELLPITDGPLDRSQDAEELYTLNGALYLIGVEALLLERSFQPPGTLAYRMPAERSIDIDEPWHLQLAEALLKDRHAA